VNIICVQKMKWEVQKVKEDTNFRLWHIGTMTIKNGVGIVIDKSLNEVVDTKRQGDMIILVKLLIEDFILNVIGAYAPEIGLDEC
jgi:exonuclease III